MSKRRVILIFWIAALAFIVLAITVCRHKNHNQDITFSDCEKAGGVI
jgi:hypothetical protein